MIEILPKLPNESTRDYITRVLLSNIINLNLIPGEQLQESELCTQLKVSRTPVREAILELSQVKIIDIYPRHGTFVSKIDSKMVEDARYLRYVLESDLAAMACDLCTDDFIEKLYENIHLQKYYEDKNPDKFLHLDYEFHYLIYKICDKEFLYDMVKRVAIHFDRTRNLSFMAKEPLHLIEDHTKMVNAIEQGDKESARSISQTHMRRSLEDIPMLKKKYPSYFIQE